MRNILDSRLLDFQINSRIQNQSTNHIHVDRLLRILVRHIRVAVHLEVVQHVLDALKRGIDNKNINFIIS